MSVPEGFDWKEPDYEAVWAVRTARLEAIRAEPDRIPGLWAHYKENPVDFINDWGVTFDPRNASTSKPTTMPFLLFPKQQEFIVWMYDRWKKRQDGLVEKSRDMGMSWCCVGFAVWMWTFHAGVVVGFGSRKEDYVDKLDDPDSLFWKARSFIMLLPVEFKPKGYDAGHDAPYMRILNRASGNIIKGEAGKNIGRGGRATVYFKDESAHYEQAESIDAALSQTADVQIDVSTPNGEGNPFWLKRHSGNVPVFVFDWRDDPRKGKDWYALQKVRLTPTALAQEVDRDYSAAVDNSFIPSYLVTEAQARGPSEVMPAGGIRVGLDVARLGSNKTVLTFRRGRAVLKQVKWGKTLVPASAGRAKQEILAFMRGMAPLGIRLEQIAVDGIGVGAGVADLLLGWFGEDIVVNVNSALRMNNGKHYNLRAFMWSQLLDALPQMSLPNDQGLRVALTAMRIKEYRGGELLLESKEEMAERGIASPDEGDSVVLTYAYPENPKKRKVIPSERVTRYPVDPEMGM